MTNINEIRALIGVRRSQIHNLYMAGAYLLTPRDKFMNNDAELVALQMRFITIKNRTKIGDR